MSLKQKIEKAYQSWERGSQFFWQKSPLESYQTSNLSEVHDQVRKLKANLCKFADEFDKYLKSIDDNTLINNSAQAIYKKIRNDFIGEIAKIGENDDFILAIRDKSVSPLKGKKDVFARYASGISKYKSKYKKLLRDFDQSKDLIDFLEKKSAKFSKASWSSSLYGISMENQILDGFIGLTLEAMDTELLTKQKAIIANDKDYFIDIDEIIKSDTELSAAVRTLESDESLKKLLPSLWQNLVEMVREEAKKDGKKENVEKMAVQPVPNNVKIFPNGKPLANEVKQAGVGDCYLMAPLIALAKSNPKAIEDCFTQGIKNIDEKEDIEIRFFRLVGRAKYPVKIVVNKNKVIDPDGITNCALWTKLIEKAYSVYRQKGYETHLGTRNKVENRDLKEGYSGNVLFAITGKYAASSQNPKSTYDPNETEPNKEKFTPEKVIETIKRKLEKKKALTCNFKNDFEIEDVKNGEKIKIHKKHAYAIVGIDINKKYIRLINPWKSDGRTYSATVHRDRTEPFNEGSHIAISFDDFKKKFINIDYTSKNITYLRGLKPFTLTPPRGINQALVQFYTVHGFFNGACKIIFYY